MIAFNDETNDKWLVVWQTSWMQNILDAAQVLASSNDLYQQLFYCHFPVKNSFCNQTIETFLHYGLHLRSCVDAVVQIVIGTVNYRYFLNWPTKHCINWILSTKPNQHFSKNIIIILYLEQKRFKLISEIILVLLNHLITSDFSVYL